MTSTIGVRLVVSGGVGGVDSAADATVAFEGEVPGPLLEDCGVEAGDAFFALVLVAPVFLVLAFAVFFAATFFATFFAVVVFFAVVFFVETFFVAFFATFFVVAVLVVAFLPAVFAATFFVVAFLAGAFLPAFFAAVLLEVVFFEVVFFEVVFLREEGEGDPARRSRAGVSVGEESPNGRDGGMSGSLKQDARVADA